MKGTELCLLGRRGKVKPVEHNVRQLVEATRYSHSQKPDEVRDRIVQLMGDLPRIELFAREKTEGWDVWGNEVEDLQEADGERKSATIHSSQRGMQLSDLARIS
jgi:N6-adenosine-specific RNA methylase IME4